MNREEIAKEALSSAYKTAISDLFAVLIRATVQAAGKKKEMDEAKQGFANGLVFIGSLYEDAVKILTQQ
ncbi:MAG: hypothetical protein NTV22_16035 [bacterium]|nr:hypothetical protein [bacterium]